MIDEEEKILQKYLDTDQFAELVSNGTLHLICYAMKSHAQRLVDEVKLNVKPMG